ncbi:hypothetical protein OAP56_04655, partial [Rickettsiaceae bacterium]|nr:hypothetical protein [Rickettsiaceae bacterium]
MKKKKLNFKKILATASAFAFVAGVSTNAMGADGGNFSRPAVVGAGNATLDVDTNLVVKSGSFGNIKNFDIKAAKKLTFQTADNITTIAGTTWKFGDGSSTVEF